LQCALAPITQVCFRIRCSVYLYVAVCCSVLQHNTLKYPDKVSCNVLQCVAVCTSVLLCVAVCCCALHCVAVCCNKLRCVAALAPDALLHQRLRCAAGYIVVCYSVLQYVAVCCSVLQCIAVYCSVCSVLQCIAMCCNVLQCIAALALDALLQ